MAVRGVELKAVRGVELKAVWHLPTDACDRQRETTHKCSAPWTLLVA